MGRLAAALLCSLLSHPLEAAAEVTVRWLGVAGFTLTSGDTTLAHDPYLSRPGILKTLFGRYRPDETVLGRMLVPGSPAPELGRASLYLVGHSHFDHLGDVPWLASRTKGRVAGSATTAAISRGYGLAPDETVIAGPGAVLDEGPFEVRVFASQHAKVMFGRVPLQGELTEPPVAPIYPISFVLGDARLYLVTERASGIRIVLFSSAGRDLHALAELGRLAAPVDLVLLASQGGDADFPRDVVRALRPRLVVPHHFDDFFLPLDDSAAGDPSDPEALAAFEQALRDAAAAEGLTLEIRRPRLFEQLLVGKGTVLSRRKLPSVLASSPAGP
jgi:L-ascorbate metabolism protein UlaG (beta-lactamase superfamily)